MASFVYLVFYLYLHACSARPLMARDKESVSSSTNIVHLDNHKYSSSVQEAEYIEGKKVNIPYSWKIQQQATVTEIWERAERSMLESPPSKAEENVSSKNKDTAEDIEVMDYAQPHRKPPIHNKGT